MSMKRAIVVTLEWLCGRLDQVPFPERTDGKIRFYKGSLGCYRLGLAEKSARLDDRWGTGVWK